MPWGAGAQQAGPWGSGGPQAGHRDPPVLQASPLPTPPSHTQHWGGMGCSVCLRCSRDEPQPTGMWGLAGTGAGMHPPARDVPRVPQPDPSPARADPTGGAALHQVGSGSARTPGDRVKARPGGAGGTWEVLAPLILAREESRTGKRLDINPATASHPAGTRPWGLPGPDPSPGPFAGAGGAAGQGGSAGKGSVWQELRPCLRQAGTATGPPLRQPVLIYLEREVETC